MKKLSIIISAIAFVGFSQSSFAGVVTCPTQFQVYNAVCTEYNNPIDPISGNYISLDSSYNFCKYHGATFDDDRDIEFDYTGVYSESPYGTDSNVWTTTYGTTDLTERVVCVALPGF